MKTRYTLESVFGAPTDARPALRKLAEGLRAYQEPEITFEELHAVKTAGQAPERIAPEAPGPSEALYKLAFELRVEQHRRDVARIEKVATIRRAVRGLTLLEELVAR